MRSDEQQLRAERTLCGVHTRTFKKNARMLGFLLLEPATGHKCTPLAFASPVAKRSMS